MKHSPTCGIYKETTSYTGKKPIPVCTCTPIEEPVMKLSNCCKAITREDYYISGIFCTNCGARCTPIEEPTEEKCECKPCAEKGHKECVNFDHGTFTKVSGISTSPKDTCEEEWVERVLTAVIYNELEDYDENRKSGWKINSDKVIELIRSLIAEKEATAREEERKRIVEIVDGLQKELEKKEGKKDLSHIGKVVYYYLHRAKTEITRP